MFDEIVEFVLLLVLMGPWLQRMRFNICAVVPTERANRFESRLDNWI
jgi:hypothetical protein